MKDQQIIATDTWYGRGCPITSREALKRVRKAYNSIGGSVKLYIDEDAFFVSANSKEGDTIIDEDDNEITLYELTDVATNEAEAIRLWWNNYGYGGENKAIYCNGNGPNGIGGFRMPINEDQKHI